MPIWLWLTIATAPSPPPADLACVLQPGATWNEGQRAVSAVRCGGRDGFFVPSLEFRTLIKPEDSEPYRLLSEELRLAKLELGELRGALAAGTSAVARLEGLVDRYERNWRQAEDDLQASEDDVLEASRRAWYESPALWFGLGVVTTVVSVIGVVVVLGRTQP